MSILRWTMHIVGKAALAIALIILAGLAQESLAPWPGPARLAGWIFVAALLQVVFHEPYPPRGRSQFVFTTPLVVLGASCIIGATLLEGTLHRAEVNPRVAIWGGGDLLFLVGLAMRFTAQQALGGLFHYNIRVVEGHRLVTGGLFKHIRHPSYAGILLMGLGAPLIANAYWSFLSFPILLGCVLVRIHYEEKALREAVPRYAEYASKTKRLIPRIY